LLEKPKSFTILGMPKLQITKRDRIIIAGILILTLLIPTGAYVLSLRMKTQSSAREYNFPVTSPKAEATASSKLLEALDRLNKPTDSSDNRQTTTENGLDEDSDSQLILGPTLGFSILIQGRPLDNQATRVFLGIAAGQPTTRPTYLLSFMINIPSSGSFDGISLSGLDSGQTYTAYIKGDAQIATSSSFVVKATPTNLAALNLITGDVNQDNVIDSLDYNLVKAALGANPASSKWNALYDFNLDNIINSWDLNIVLANINKIGASGAWYSYTPIATASAQTSLVPTTPSVGSESSEITPGTTDENQGRPGYWMWIPN
jgi:hypothetical protein